MFRNENIASVLRGQTHFLPRSDYLDCTVITNGVGPVPVRVRVRFFDLDKNKWDVWVHDFTAADGTSTSVYKQLGNALITNAEIRTDFPCLQMGTTFGHIVARTGNSNEGANNTAVATLCQGFLALSKHVTFPFTGDAGFNPEARAILVLQSSDPAAGSEVSYTVPYLERFELVSVRTRLITSAIVATRIVDFVIDDGTTVLFEFPSSISQAAGTTKDYQWTARGTGDSDIIGVINISIPPGIELVNGFRIRTVTQNLQVGDDFGKMTILAKYQITRK